MTKTTASKQRYFDNAVLVFANRLLFDRLKKTFSSCKLLEIVNIHNGQSLVAEDRDETGSFPVYAAGGPIGIHSEKLSDNPFVVIGRKGSAGKPTYAPRGGWVIDTAYFAQPKSDSIVDTKFLFYAISNLDFSNDVISTAIPGINRTAIYQHSIPLPPINFQKVCVKFLDSVEEKKLDELPDLPPSLEAQRRIVARIEELAAKVEEARGLRRQAVEEGEALFENQLISIYFSLEEAYEKKKFREFCDVVRGGSPRPAGSPEFYEGSIPFLKVADLTKDNLTYLTDYTSTIKEAGLTKTRYVEPYTLLLTNSGATLGVPKVCTFATTFNDGIQALLNIPNTISQEYLYYFLRSKTKW